MPTTFEKIDRIKPVFDLVYNITFNICKILLIFDITITSVAVLGRYVSFIPDPAWSEEVVLSCMAYMAMLSAALAIRRKSHIRMTAFDAYLPEKVVIITDILADIAIFILAIIMIKVGWGYAERLGRFGSYVSMPSVSRFWMYFPVPLAGISMIFFLIESFYNNVKRLYIKDGAKI